ncbi:hypothetical protein BSKO_07608 [Bryopsis sp. KO-2023]|nr:hypothetical protein BSKO_07608 [Bryopsis sp. KO-2023]
MVKEEQVKEEQVKEEEVQVELVEEEPGGSELGGLEQRVEFDLQSNGLERGLRKNKSGTKIINMSQLTWVVESGGEMRAPELGSELSQKVLEVEEMLEMAPRRSELGLARELEVVE